MAAEVTARCFWWPSCMRTVTGQPQDAHDRMEEHYQDRHADDIARITGWFGGDRLQRGGCR